MDAPTKAAILPYTITSESMTNLPTTSPTAATTPKTKGPQPRRPFARKPSATKARTRLTTVRGKRYVVCIKNPTPTELMRPAYAGSVQGQVNRGSNAIPMAGIVANHVRQPFVFGPFIEDPPAHLTNL